MNIAARERDTSWITDLVSVEESTPAGTMRFAGGTPVGPLAEWIESAWYSEGALEALSERVLPSGTADIVLNLGDEMQRADLPDGPQAIRAGTASGMLLQAMILKHPPIHRAVGVRLTPFGVSGLLGVPTGRMNDLVVDLDATCGPPGRRVTEHCADAREPIEVIRRFLGWLWEHSRRFGREPDSVARWAAAKIDAARGDLAIRDLQRASGYGATRFIRRFKDELGVTPKGYARLVRFRRALELLAPDVSLADVALEAGFSDQSHMGAEFRRLAGRTPLEVLATRYPAGLTMAE